MADFVAVIRKAVDNLSENTPENRTRVYDKARAAIRRQLEAMNPQPSDEVIARQLEKLDKAIDEVELEHAEALPPEDDETDQLMAELESMVEQSPVVAAPPPQPAPAPQSAPPPPTPAAVTPPPAPKPVAAPQPVAQPASELVGAAHDEAFGLDDAPSRSAPAAARPARRGKGGVLALVLLLLVAAAGYAGWLYKDQLTAMLGGSSDTAIPVAVEEPAPETPSEPEVAAPAAETATPAETAPAGTAPAETATPADDGKFTQRLMADGSEVDAGPAPGPVDNEAVEGRSVAGQSDATPADETVAEESTAEAPVTAEDATAPDPQALGVAQKMILYEERLGQQSLEVKQGTVVWTLVSEPQGEGPDELVIRGEINNPDTGLSALLTIKRNTDPSLPASHLVEVVFALPADFDGGSIDQLQRIAMKQTEADQGNPLIAVPAKITQDFYMVALNDLDEARKANAELLRQRNWIDIPIVYANGRQALITLEKGASGTEVFNQALDAWARAGG